MKAPIKNKRASKREVDILTQDIGSWWGKTFVFIKKTQVKTWKGVFVLAFIAGVAAASAWIVSFNIQTSSDAAGGATLTIYTDDTEVTLENGSNMVNADVLLNSHSNDVVAVKAIVNYDASKFELQSWDTSNSVFASNNSCVYDGKPCEIITNDPENGKITITLAKPSPGVRTDSGIIAQLVFKSLQITVPASPNFTLSYTTSGDYEDSDVIGNDGDGTDILSVVENATVNVYSAVCNSFVYSSWGECQPNESQFRTVTASLPENCFGGNPILEQACEYEGTVDCTEITYSEWGACQSNGTQSRTVIAKTPENCVESDLELTQGCTYNPPTCTNFTYSDWSACQTNNTQSRTVLSSSPSGCSGGQPILSQGCVYDGGDETCVSFEYSDWSACQPNGLQSRTTTSSSPSGCSGGNPELLRTCQYADKANLSSEGEGDGINSDAKEKKKKDKEKPKFVSMPNFLNKNRGDMIWWKAKDNKGIAYYTYNFNGKKTKTKKKHFFVPVTTRSGIYLLRIKAFDEAGNSKTRLVTIRVR